MENNTDNIDNIDNIDNMKNMVTSYFTNENICLNTTNDNIITILYDVIYNNKKMYVDQNNPELMNYFGVISTKINNIEAEPYFLAAIKHNNIDSMYNLAIMYKCQGKYTEAERYYLMAIEHNHIDAIHYLAYMYYDQKKYAEAERYYLMAIDYNSTNTSIMNNLAATYICQDKYIEAEYYFLLAINDNNICAMNNLASMYERQEKYIESEHYYLMAIEHNNLDAISNLASLYDKLNNHKKLLCLYRKHNNTLDLDSLASNLVKKVLAGELTVSNDILLEICYFDYENDYVIYTNFFSIRDIIKLNILKRIGIIPNFTNQEYHTYKYVLNNIIPYRKFFKYVIHYNTLIYICRKIFNDINDVIADIIADIIADVIA